MHYIGLSTVLVCEIGWLAPQTKHFNKVFQWYKAYLKNIARFDGINNVIYFQNGSVLYFYSMDNYDAIRGQTFDFRIMDEFAFGRFGEPAAIEAYDATFIAKGKQELILSTPKGKNQHYRAYLEACEADNEFAYEMKTADNPMVDKKWLRQKSIDLPRAMFQQEYEGKFIESGGEVFTGLDNACILTEYARQQPNCRYVFGVDWGAKNDKSVLTIIEEDSGDVAEIVYSYLTDYPAIIKQFSDVLSNYNLISGYAETNGVGQAAFDYFKRLVPMARPFNMSQKTKSDGVQYLRTNIQTERIKLPERHLCPELYNELSDYEVKVSLNGSYSYSHPKGKHDDYVDSLMMANLALRRHISVSPPKPLGITRRNTTFR